jgi:uncharacterized protein YjcR
MGETEFRRTWLVREKEQTLKLHVPRFLYQAYWKERRSYADIGYDLGVSATTIGKYIRALGWSRMQAADRAFEMGLIPEEMPYERIPSEREERRRERAS